MATMRKHEPLVPVGRGHTFRRAVGVPPARTKPRAWGKVATTDRHGTLSRASGPGPYLRPGLYRRPGRDRGQAAVEFAGWVALLITAALAAVQLGIIAYAAQQAGTAARAAARVASQGGDGEAAGRAAMSGWLADGAVVSAPAGAGVEDVTATVTVSVPTVLPLLGIDPVRRTTTMPVTAAEGGNP